MKRILFCCLLLTGICLSGCTGQINQLDTPPSTSEESGVLPGSESEESTKMPPKELADICFLTNHQNTGNRRIPFAVAFLNKSQSFI